jgi:hypothetical protein
VTIVATIVHRVVGEFGARFVLRPAALEEDEGDIGPTHANVGQCARVDGIKFGGGPLAPAPAHEPVDRRSTQRRKDGRKKPPRVNPYGDDRPGVGIG